MLNLVGNTYGRLTVIAKDMTRNSVHSFWLCKCSCGTTKSVRMTGLRSGRTKSCGCLNRDRVTRHGMYGTPEYRAWKSMKARCSDPAHPQFSDYGGRGIVVAPEWQVSFDPFFAHIGRRPSRSHSLDRIDNDQGYVPGNVRWATKVRQARNRRGNRVISYRGASRTLSEWAETVGIRPDTLRARIEAGWPLDKAMTPSRKYRR